MVKLPSVLARAVASIASAVLDGRVDAAERAELLAGHVEGVDLDTSPTPEETAPRSPFERLGHTPGVIVSRDFRKAGRGAEWDRLAKYDPQVYGWPIDKSRGQSRGARAWEKIDTIVLHTAGVSGMHPDRWLGVPCHAAVANDATIVLCHDLRAYLHAAHAANRYSVSIEIAGNKTISPMQANAARALLRYFVEELRERRGDGAPLYVIPHRSAHKSRAEDCGPAIWAAVGEWSLANLGLEIGDVVGSGKPVPDAWRAKVQP